MIDLARSWHEYSARSISIVNIRRNPMVGLSEADAEKWSRLMKWVKQMKSASNFPDIEGNLENYRHIRTSCQQQKRLTEFETDRLMNDYNAGRGVCELAADFGIHRIAVSDLLDKRGVQRRIKGLGPEQAKIVIKMYEQGSSLAKIGNYFGVSPRTILKILRDNNVLMRDSHGREKS